MKNDKLDKSFTKKLLDLNATRLKAIVVSAMIFLSFSHVMAQSNLEDIQVQSGANGAVNINFIFDGTAVVPEVFATQVPARIALDFNSTNNTSNKRTVAVGIGNAKSIRIVSTDNKTRAVIDLFDSGNHEVKVSGNILTMVIKSNFRNFTDTKPDEESLVEFVDFRRGTSGQGIITIRFNNSNGIVNLSETFNKLLIEVSSAKLDSSMNRKMDVVDFATPVTFIDARQSGNNVTIEVEPVGSYTHLAYQTGNEYVLEITELDTSAEDLTKLLDDEVIYEGNLVSFNFQDIAVRSVIQLIADASQLNIVVADNVTGSVTLRLNNVPWDQALDIVLQSKQLDQRRKGDVIMVATAADIAEREKLKLETLRGKEELEALSTVFIQVNYSKAEDLAALISGQSSGSDGGGTSGGFLSDRGSVTSDERTNTLLVSDIPDRIVVIQELVNTLDKAVQQVQIEARIVVATDRFGDELGVRFGVTGSKQDRYGNIISTGGSSRALDRLNNAALINRYTSPSGSGVPTLTPDFANAGNPIVGAPLNDRLNVNLPTAISSAGRWAFSILSADYLLDLEISALESEDRGEVISSPRVITTNQTQATIKQGVDIPYETAASSGATTISFKEAVLSLVVTPLITPDDRIDLTLKVDQDAIGEEVSTSLGGSVPSIDTRSVETRVLVENGQTVVLGGIYEQVRRTTKSKVPFLGDIPGVGNLFRNKSVQDEKAELLIFVTPTIIKESL